MQPFLIDIIEERRLETNGSVSWLNIWQRTPLCLLLIQPIE